MTLFLSLYCSSICTVHLLILNKSIHVLDQCRNKHIRLIDDIKAKKSKKKNEEKMKNENTPSVKIMIGFEIIALHYCIYDRMERERLDWKENVLCARRWFGPTTFSSLSSMNKWSKSCSSSLIRSYRTIWQILIMISNADAPRNKRKAIDYGSHQIIEYFKKHVDFSPTCRSYLFVVSFDCQY